MGQSPRGKSKTEIIGESPAFRKALKELKLAARRSDATILIVGKTGVGKSRAAKWAHEATNPDKPFVEANCSSIPNNLMDSYLFGHKKGAFTGAVSDKAGRFQLADGGTLFLDEIGELDLGDQKKLLNAIENKLIEPVGGTKQVGVNVRIMAATNKNLEEEVKAGRFRKDLYFRLAVFEIELPSLNDREGDVLLLAKHFLEQKETPKYLTAQAQDALDKHYWNGHVRELNNVLERAYCMSPGEIMDVEHLIFKRRFSNPQQEENLSEPEKGTLGFFESMGKLFDTSLHEALELSSTAVQRIQKSLTSPKTNRHFEEEPVNREKNTANRNQNPTTTVPRIKPVEFTKEIEQPSQHPETGTGLTGDQITLLSYATKDRSMQELMIHVARKDRKSFREQYVRPLLDAHLLAMTIPEKPNSNKQRYMVTEYGRRMLSRCR